MPQLRCERTGDVFVITLDNPAAANALDDTTLDEFNAHLDAIEATEGNVALVITAEDDKFFSNGINLAAMQDKGGITYLVSEFVPRLDRLLVRLAWFGCPTVCAINGHAFGGGALIASVCDFRTMRADRGFFCFPEVDIKLPFTPVMTDCVGNLPNEAARRRMALTGQRVGGSDMLALGLVEAVCPADELAATSLALAAQLAQKHRPTYTAIKRSLLAPRWQKWLA